MPYTREHFALRVDNDLALIVVIRAGYGIGICQMGIAAREPGLVRLPPEKIALKMDTWLLMHEDLRRSLRARPRFDHLALSLIAYIQTYE